MELILLISFSVAIVTLGGVSICAAIDDVRNVRRQRAYRSRTHHGEDQPTVTVLLRTGAHTQGTRDALKNIVESSYRSIEIILIGTKHQRPELKKMAAYYDEPSRPIAIYTGNGTPSVAYRRYGRGSIIITLASHVRIDSHAIERGVWHFRTQPGIDQLRANTIITTRYSTVGLLQTYTSALGHVWGKLSNVIESISTIGTPGISLHRAGAYLIPRARSTRTYFAENVIAYRPASPLGRSLLKSAIAQLARAYRTLWHTPSRQPIITWNYRFIAIGLGYVSVSLPILLSYAIYLAVAAHQPLPLFAGIMLVGVCALIGLWSQPGRSLRQRIRLSLATPVCFIPFYALSFIVATMTLIVCAHTLRTLAAQAAGTVKRSFAR